MIPKHLRPKEPLGRIVYEGCLEECPHCGSSIIHKFPKFWRTECANPECVQRRAKTHHLTESEWVEYQWLKAQSASVVLHNKNMNNERLVTKLIHDIGKTLESGDGINYSTLHDMFRVGAWEVYNIMKEEELY